MHALLESSASYQPDRYMPADLFDSSSYYTPPPPPRRRPLRVIIDDDFRNPPPVDAADEQVAKAAERANKHNRAMLEVTQRLRDLQQNAAVECEPISIPSAVALHSFLMSLCITARPSIFLLENGNFQVVWRNDAAEQISLQFIGREIVQFALFAVRPHVPIARIAGQDTAAEVLAKISEHGCRHLIV